MDPIMEVEEEEESASPYSPPMVTPMAQEIEQMTLANILREMEVSRRETFDQLRADRRQSEIFLQEHIQRLVLREDERRRRRRSSSEDSSHGRRRRRHDYDGGGRHNPIPQRQPPPIKISKFKGENDPNLYIEWGQKVDKIFNIHLVSDQEQVDLVVLEFEDYATTWCHQLCMDNINQEPPSTIGGRLF